MCTRRVTNLEILDNYKLHLTFDDGVQTIYDCTQLFEHEIFQPLKDPSLFTQAYLYYGTVTWNDDLGISSDEFYRNGTRINE